MATDKERLLSEFPAISTQEWKDKIVTDLKGADFERKLVWRTNEDSTSTPSIVAKTSKVSLPPK